MQEKPINKINVSSEHEITDLASLIEDSKSENVLLSFTQHSDLLVSTISIDVLLEIADDADKTLVFQVLDNPAGARNVMEAGATLFDKNEPIPADIWESAFTTMQNRKRELTDALKRSSGVIEHGATNEELVDNVAENTVDLQSALAGENAVENGEEGEKFPEEGSSDEMLMSEKTEDSVTGNDPEGELGEDSDAEVGNVGTEEADPLDQEPRSEFQKRIDRVLQKSKHGIEVGRGKTVTEGGLAIALDHDISADDLPTEGSEKGRDDSNKKAVGMGLAAASGSTLNSKSTPLRATSAGSGSSGNSLPKFADEAYPKPETDLIFDKGDLQNSSTLSGQQVRGKTPITGFPHRFDASKPIIAGNSRDGKAGMKGLKKIAPMIAAFLKSPKLKKSLLYLLIPIILIGGLAAYLGYTYLPLVRVSIFIESRPIAVEREFVGDTNITTFEPDTGKVPLKREVIKKERSDATNATGTAERGEKATGLVKFVCGPQGPDDITVTLPSGTLLSTNAGLQYTLISQVEFICPTISSFPTGTIQASQIGSEYNINSGVRLNMADFPAIAATTETSISGGSKAQYTVITQEDFGRVVNPLKEVAFSEGESDLAKLATDGWTIVPNSTKSQLDGEITSDFPVRAEAEILNVTVKTESSALFYKKSELDNVAEEILLAAAEEKSLFESEADLSLQLSNDIISDVTVKSIEGEVVTLLLTVSGSVKPSVDRDELIRNLRGKGLSDGLNYLNKLSFVAKKTEVTFQPDYFPVNLRYFPARQGRIILTVKEIEVTPELEAVEEGVVPTE